MIPVSMLVDAVVIALASIVLGIEATVKMLMRRPR